LVPVTNSAFLAFVPEVVTSVIAIFEKS